MFKEVSLIWDLNCNDEIKEFDAPHHFSEPEDFVQLGINTNIYKDIHQNDTSKILIQQNNEASLFIQPMTNEFDNFSIFRTFTPVDNWEIQNHFWHLQQQLMPSNFDFEAILANYYGRNYFDIFKSSPDLMNAVHEKMQENNYKPFID